MTTRVYDSLKVTDLRQSSKEECARMNFVELRTSSLSSSSALPFLLHLERHVWGNSPGPRSLLSSDLCMLLHPGLCSCLETPCCYILSVPTLVVLKVTPFPVSVTWFSDLSLNTSGHSPLLEAFPSGVIWSVPGSPVGGSVWGAEEARPCWIKNVTGGGLWGLVPHFWLILSFVLVVGMCAPSFRPWVPCLCLAVLLPCTVDSYASGTISSNKL